MSKMKENEAHNVPVPMPEEQKPLDIEKYKHLLKLSTDEDKSEAEKLKAQQPSLRAPMADNGGLDMDRESVKLMSRAMDIWCPHCGELAGRFHLLHRLAASEETPEPIILTEESNADSCSLGSLEEVELSYAQVKKYESLWNKINQ